MWSLPLKIILQKKMLLLSGDMVLAGEGKITTEVTAINILLQTIILEILLPEEINPFLSGNIMLQDAESGEERNAVLDKMEQEIKA